VHYFPAEVVEADYLFHAEGLPVPENLRESSGSGTISIN
jgi:hypothetical protein